MNDRLKVGALPSWLSDMAPPQRILHDMLACRYALVNKPILSMIKHGNRVTAEESVAREASETGTLFRHDGARSMSQCSQRKNGLARGNSVHPPQRCLA